MKALTVEPGHRIFGTTEQEYVCWSCEESAPIMDDWMIAQGATRDAERKFYDEHKHCKLIED